MDELMGSVSGLVIAIGPLVGLLVLLNVRERREGRLLDLLHQQLGSRELRGHFTTRVRCRWLGPGGVAEVYLAGCSRDEVRTMATRLARSLPPGVRLEVTGLLEGGRTVSFAVRPRSSAPLAGPIATHVGRP